MRNSPGRTGVSYEDVAAAAEAFVAAGDRPTLRKVRDKLGTGSLGTIQKHLSTWQASRVPVEIPRVALSAGLTEALLDEIARHLQAAKEESSLELGEARAARDELAEELERKVGQLESTVASQEGTIAQLRADAAAMAKRIAQVTRELGRAELKLEQVGPLKDTVVDLQGRLQAEQQARQAAEHQAALLTQASAQQTAAGIALEARLVELQEALRTSQQLISELSEKG
jgi:uncharacterized coiled-coil protein SlyX